MKEIVKELLEKINLLEIIAAFIETIIGGYFIKINIDISSMFLMLAGFHIGKRIIWR